MALELSQLVFTANTDGLKAAIGTMNQVKSAISSLELAQTKAATQSSKASKAASDAAKAEAQAALAAIKLEKEKQKAIKDSADATVSAGNRSISVLEKQEQVLQFMVQGYSRGQSSILATAKAAGAATDELAKLGSTLQSQRTLMGSDPFDKSLGALRALKNEFSVVKEQVRLYNAELGLTKKQSEDLARDKLRLIEASKIEGKSLFSVRDSVKELNMEYIRLAKSENDLVAQYKQNVKNTQDTAKANSYLETELQKVRFAVDEQNAALNRGSANAIVRFENALKKSGKTVAEQKVLLDEYRKSLDKLQGAGGARATDYISRAVGPQLTDIIVGLSTGQSLMTVMMQQGGQLRDQFAMMGVAGAEMGMVMRTALSSMTTSIKDTALAFGQLFVGGVMDASKAVNSFAGRLTGLTVFFDTYRYKLYQMGQEGSTWGQALYDATKNAGKGLSILTGGLLTVAVAGVVALGVAAYQTMKENNELAKSLALSGGSLAISHQSALMYVEALNSMGVTTGNATKALSAMAKEGTFSSQEILLVAKSASEMSKWAGIAIEDTVKAFAKLKEKPVEALVELAMKTGMVSVETLKMVKDLETQGKTVEASAAAVKAYADVTSEQTARMKENYNDLTVSVIDMGDKISQFFSKAFKSLFMAPDVAALQEQLAKVNESIDKNRNLPTFGTVFGGKNALKELEDQREALKDQLNQLQLKSAAEEYSLKINRENAKVFETVQSALKDANRTIDQSSTKTLSLSDYTAKYVKEKLKGVDASKEELAVLEKAAGIEWQSMQKKGSGGGSKEDNHFANLLRRVTNEAIGAEAAQDKLTKAYTLMLEIASDPGFLKFNESQKARIMNILNEAHNTELATEANKRYAEGQELINKLLGKGEGLGKDYYASLSKLESLKGAPGFNLEDIEAAIKALNATTPHVKAMAQSTTETKLQLENIRAQNLEMDNNLALLGLNEEAQKRLTLEFTKQRDLMKAKADYDKIQSDINANPSYGTGEDRQKALSNAAEVYAANLQLINRKAVDDLFTYFVSKGNEAGKSAFGSLSDVLKQAGQLTFANAVNSLGELIDNFDTLTAKQELYNKARAEAQGDTSKLQKLDKAHAALQVKSYGDIAKSMKGFFKEGTTGYKVMGAAEKAFRVYEMAMAVKNNAFKLAAMWGEVKTFVATTAKMIAGVTAEESAKTATRVPGIFAAFMSTMGPWGIPAAIAAMAAVGIAASGSSAPAVVTNQGTGTVFGDSSAKSETISNSLGVLEDVNTLTMRYSAEMLKSLRSIETSLAGVTNVILRSNGMELSAAGIVEGTKLSGFGALTNTVLNAFGLDKILTGVLGKLFGTKTTITGQGVMVQDASYQQILSQNVEAGYYTDVNRKGKFLGITTSDKNSTNYKADKELSDQFSKLLNGFVDTIKSAAPILGISLDTIDNNLKDFVLKIGKIDLKDLKGDEIKEKLMSVFGAAGDDLARQAMAGFEKYQQVGEGYLETIVRLASTVESVRGSLDTLNSTFVLSVDNAMALVDAFGDLDTLTTAMSDYNQAYYSESERNATLQRQLTREFTAQNLTLPKNKEEYRKLVEAQDLSTEAGRAMYAFLLTLAPVFAQIADAAEDLAAREAEALASLNSEIAASRKELSDQILQQEAAMLDAQGRTAEADKKRRELLDIQRARENERLMALNPELAAMAYNLWLLEDATSDATRAAKQQADAEAAREAAAKEAETARNNAISAAYSQLQKAVEKEKAVLNERVTASQELISTLTSIFDTVSSAVKELYNQVDSTAAMSFAAAKSYISGVFTSVKAGGGIGDSAKLSTAVQDALAGLDAGNYSTKQDYDRERLRLAGQLDVIGDSAEVSLTNEQMVLESLEDQIDKLDETLAYWKDMIDIANGTYVATVAIGTAIATLNSLLKPTTGTVGKGGAILNPDGSVTTGGGASFGGGSSGGSSGTYSYYKPVGLGTSVGYQPITDAVTIAKLDKLSSVYHGFDGTGDLTGLLTAIKSAGGTMYDLEALSGYFYNDWVKAGLSVGIPAFANGGNYQGGLALVGEEGPELINFSRGGTVHTAAQTAGMLGSGGNLEGRIASLESSAATTAQALSNIATYTKRTADTLRNISPGGDSIQVESSSFLEI